MKLNYDEDENSTEVIIDGNTIGSVDGPLITRNGTPHPDSDNIEEFYSVINSADTGVYRRCLFDVAIGAVDQS